MKLEDIYNSEQAAAILDVSPNNAWVTVRRNLAHYERETGNVITVHTTGTGSRAPKYVRRDELEKFSAWWQEHRTKAPKVHGRSVVINSFKMPQDEAAVKRRRDYALIRAAVMRREETR